MVNFNYEAKSHWRDWAWSTMVKLLGRSGKRPCDAFAIYLAGPEDWDRGIANTFGIKDINLVAVDQDFLSIEPILSKKYLAIDMNLGPLLALWGEEPQIDLVMADFCSGFSNNIIQFMTEVIISKGLSDLSVICVNLLRGRDPKVKELDRRFGNDLHRGKIFFENFIRRVNHVFAGVLNNFGKECSLNFNYSGTIGRAKKVYWEGVENLSPEKYSWNLDMLSTQPFRLEDCRSIGFDSCQHPQYYTYHSESGKVFDSVIFQFLPIHEKLITKYGKKLTIHNHREIKQRIGALKRRRTKTVVNLQMEKFYKWYEKEINL